MNNKTFRDHISQQCGFTPNKAADSMEKEPVTPNENRETGVIVQGWKGEETWNEIVTRYNNEANPSQFDSIGKEQKAPIQKQLTWPSVESQEEHNLRMDEREQDRYEQQEDIGGNLTRDRIEANHDQYDNTKHPFE